MCSKTNTLGVKKRLPIGEQSFKSIRERKENLYIDKTENIIEIINGAKYNFFSRPRRFGKSLLISTMKSLYEGRKQDFYNTYAKKNWDFEKTNPVVHISFGSGISDIEDIILKLNGVINYNARENNVELTEVLYSDKFKELFEKIYKKTGKRIVVLIDEYDKLILDFIDKIEDAKIIKEKLKTFYAVLKDADEYLEFVFITGVSKFSKVSLFSGLNNLKDLTLNPIAGELAGFTEKEIKDNLEDYLKEPGKEVDFSKMQKWYNGFNFLGENKVYNPYDILLFLDSKEYKAHWFETATPTFLIKLLQKEENFYHIPDLQNISAGEELLGSFDIENISIETLLFQTGYLTIKEVKRGFDETSYKLKIPNQEIRKSLNNYIITDYLQAYKKRDFLKRAEPIYEALINGNIDDFIKYLKVLFANISYTNSLEKIAKYEGYYSSIIYCLFYTMGLEVIQEDITNQGRIDLTIKLEGKIFIIEFKVEKSGLEALEQIKDKKYSEKYLDNSEIYEVGINFSFENRNIDNYNFERIK